MRIIDKYKFPLRLQINDQTALSFNLNLNVTHGSLYYLLVLE